MRHSRLQLALLLCQQPPALVFIGDDGDGQRPLEPQPRVVVHQPALAAGRIKLSRLIAGLGFVAQHLVPMSEALRNVECAGVVFAQLNRHMIEIGWAFRPQVHDDIENGAPGAAHKLSLRRRRKLKVHAPQGPFFVIKSDVGLGDGGFESVCLKFLLAKGAREKAASILFAVQVNCVGALQLGFSKNHIRESPYHRYDTATNPPLRPPSQTFPARYVKVFLSVRGRAFMPKSNIIPGLALLPDSTFVPRYVSRGATVCLEARQGPSSGEVGVY